MQARVFQFVRYVANVLLKQFPAAAQHLQLCILNLCFGYFLCVLQAVAGLAELSHFCVAQDHQRGGVGQALLNQVLLPILCIVSTIISFFVVR